MDGNSLQRFDGGYDGAAGDRAWLRHLTELDLSDNMFNAVPPALAAATSLRRLHLQQQCV